MAEHLRFPASVPTLHGELLYLRELTEEDIPPWFARATDAESASLAGDPIPESIEAGTSWLAVHRARFADQAGIRWAVVPNGESASIGTIGLNIASRPDRTAELGYVIGRAHWGKGFCSEATRLVTAFAFEEMGLREVRGEVLQRNHASIRVLEKTGFQRERAFTASDGEDCYIYVLDAPRA